eukprot:Clim_evm13s215 gene=Clim_evmTU13s215
METDKGKDPESVSEQTNNDSQPYSQQYHELLVDQAFARNEADRRRLAQTSPRAQVSIGSSSSASILSPRARAMRAQEKQARLYQLNTDQEAATGNGFMDTPNGASELAAENDPRMHPGAGLSNTHWNQFLHEVQAADAAREARLKETQATVVGAQSSLLDYVRELSAQVSSLDSQLQASIDEVALKSRHIEELQDQLMEATSRARKQQETYAHQIHHAEDFSASAADRLTVMEAEAEDRKREIRELRERLHEAKVTIKEKSELIRQLEDDTAAVERELNLVRQNRRTKEDRLEDQVRAQEKFIKRLARMGKTQESTSQQASAPSVPPFPYVLPTAPVQSPVENSLQRELQSLHQRFNDIEQRTRNEKQQQTLEAMAEELKTVRQETQELRARLVAKSSPPVVSAAAPRVDNLQTVAANPPHAASTSTAAAASSSPKRLDAPVAPASPGYREPPIVQESAAKAQAEASLRNLQREMRNMEQSLRRERGLRLGHEAELEALRIRTPQVPGAGSNTGAATSPGSRYGHTNSARSSFSRRHDSGIDHTSMFHSQSTSSVGRSPVKTAAYIDRSTISGASGGGPARSVGPSGRLTFYNNNTGTSGHIAGAYQFYSGGNFPARGRPHMTAPAGSPLGQPSPGQRRRQYTSSSPVSQRRREVEYVLLEDKLQDAFLASENLKQATDRLVNRIELLNTSGAPSPHAPTTDTMRPDKHNGDSEYDEDEDTDESDGY